MPLQTSGVEEMTKASDWQRCPRYYRWTLDKLLVMDRLNTHNPVLCGPSGEPVPRDGFYAVRPVMNISGMGRGLSKRFLKTGETIDEPGFFWSEWLDGPVYSADLQLKGEIWAEWAETDCVCIGHPSPKPGRFHTWSLERGRPEKALKVILTRLASSLPYHTWFNVEMIGDRIIEINWHRNTDFRWGNKVAVPIYFDDDEDVVRGLCNAGLVFKPDEDGDRQGFMIDRPRGFFVDSPERSGGESANEPL